MPKRFKCPYCDKHMDRDILISHVETKHSDMIPQGYSAARVVFNSINKKDHGTCVVCKKDTTWNEKTCKYNRLCGDPKCTKTLRENAKKNHIRVYGTSTLLNDPMHQEKMLANRRISGNYKFSDGGIHTYTGKYELKCLEFFDKVVGARSDEVISPGPVLEYMFKGQLKKYISDIYYVPYNLIIECKDGGDNPNKREMEEYREKTVAKEEMITNQGKYNYLRLTNNNFGQLLEVLAELKMNMIDNDDSKVVRINEAEEFERNDKSTSAMHDPSYVKYPECWQVEYNEEEDDDNSEDESYEKDSNLAVRSAPKDPRNAKVWGMADNNKANDSSLNFMEDAVYGEYKSGACMLTIMPATEYEEPVLGITTDPSMSEMITKDPEGLKCMPIDATDDPRNIKVYKIKDDGELDHRFKWDDPARNLYECVSGNEMLCNDQIDYDDKFELIEFSNFQIKKDILANSIIEEAHYLMGINNNPVVSIESEKFKIKLWEEGRALENSDIYQDEDGFYVKNYNNHNRTKSHKKLDDISQEELYIVDNEPVHIDNIKDSNSRPLDGTISYINLPFFSPSELQGFGYYNGEAPRLKTIDIPKDVKNREVSLEDWFASYNLAYHGIYTEDYEKLHPIIIKTLYKLQEMYDNETADREEIREDMIKLGWNPVMEFNSANMVRASNRNRSILLNNTIEILDIDSIKEATVKPKVYPIYVVLIEGKNIAADIIRKYQNDGLPFSHAAISMDESLKKLYSFNLLYNDTNRKNTYSGFSIESIETLKNKEKIGVYAIFTTKENKAKMKKAIEELTFNIDKTSYSLLNIFALPFNKVINIDKSMICSQFVDSILKFCHMNNSKKNSALVIPTDIYKDLDLNKKAFKIYEDIAEKYKPKDTLKKISKLFDVSVVAENTILNEIETPIKFDEDGNLLIKHIRVYVAEDYEREYERSHKILVASDKSNNIESMKYELAKLWFLNLSIENKLRNRVLKINKEPWNKVRSKILTDFNKYLKIVNTKDPSFVFSDYYSDSIYNIYETKVTSSTLGNSIKLLKSILR